MSQPSPSCPEAVAVIGLAGRFPGARDLTEFWSRLRDGAESISFFTPEELEGSPLEPRPDPRDPRLVPARAVLERPEWFDAAFFGCTPQEAKVMDPQHRIFLECAWEALEDAGCDPARFPGSIGVFAGASLNTYFAAHVLAQPGLIAAHGLFPAQIGNHGDFLTTRVSYKFDLRGPSVNVQTACSTSLVAVCLAAQSLLAHRCDAALAGGVSITFPQRRGHLHAEGGIFSADGHCRAFDAAATGTVSGDGAGVVLLRRLSDALADGDPIRAVIRGAAVNNDGAAKIGYTAPGSTGQAEAIALAHAEAGFAPETVGYIEAHGTGTPLGDPIEVAGLVRAFGGRAPAGTCALGSVKTNLGHLDAAAGVAGLIKTILALQHRELPPSLHFRQANPAVDFAGSPFFVNDRLRPWPGGPTPRRAGVSSFGIGGTNAHVALEEAPLPVASSPVPGPQLLVLSARSPAALTAMADNLAAHLEATPGLNLADAAWTLQSGRRTFAHRRAVVVRSPADAAAVLRGSDSRRTVTMCSEAAGTRVAFLFPGQGIPAAGAARGLYATDAAFRAEIDAAVTQLQLLLGVDLRTLLWPAAGDAAAAARLQETRFLQPALFVLGHALAQHWRRQGIEPAALLGHSLGEYVAACLAGVFTFAEGLALVTERARLMQAQPAGAMVAVSLPEAELRRRITPPLALAAVNAPGLGVVSGPFDAIGALERELTAGAIPFRRLPTSHAFHSPLMDGAVAPFAEVLRRVPLRPPHLPFISNVTGDWITPAQARSPEYWLRHLREPVRFADGVALLADSGYGVLLEAGPGSALSGLVRRHPSARERVTAVPGLGRGGDGVEESESLLLALGELWAAGVAVDWRTAVHRGRRRARIPLPTYPFERARHWIEPAGAVTSGPVAASAPETTSGPGDPLAGLRSLLGELSGLDLADAPPEATLAELGLDSLFLTQASAALSHRFGVPVSLRQLREEFTSLGALADHLGGARPPGPEEVPVAPAEPAAPAARSLPLTEAQRELWLACQLGDDVAAAYHEGVFLRLSGPLDRAALGQALDGLGARHEALNAVFPPGDAGQVIRPPAPVALTWERLDEPEAASAPARESAWRAAQLRRPFDLAGGPLWRAAVLAVSPEEHRLALVVHHLVCDGWSLGLLARELATLYAAAVAGHAPALPPAPGYARHVAAVAADGAGGAAGAAAEYWKKQYEDGAPVLALPSDRPRSAGTPPSGGLLVRPLAPAAAAAVRQLAAEARCTPFTVLFAGCALLLHRLTGQDDLVIGVPAASQVLAGSPGLVGHFANLLPVRCRLRDDATARGHLAAARAGLGEALEHWSHPFHHVIRGLNLPRDPDRVPLAPVVFNATAARPEPPFGPVAATRLFSPAKPVSFDLNFNAAWTDDGLVLACAYRAELFDESTILRWFGHYERLLVAMAESPEARAVELPLLSLEESRRLLVAWNATARPFDRSARIHDLILAQAARTPDAVAVTDGRRRLTYAGLVRSSGALAARLLDAGVGPDVPVGLQVGRSVDLVVGMLGILRAGGAYVPLDPAHPRDRREWIATEAGLGVIVTDSPADLPTGNFQTVAVDASADDADVAGAPDVEPSADHLAYVLFTSGSTGRPKGVCIPHRAVVALVAWATEAFSPEERAGVFAGTSATFDLSVFEVFVPLATGGRVIIGENLLAAASHPEASAVTLLNGVPSACAELVRRQGVPSSTRVVVLAGEPLPTALVDALAALVPAPRVVECYGPTETTVYSTGGVRAAGSPPSLGRPLPNERAYVLDRHLEPVPVGIPGELFIGGEKLARGYLGRPDLTAGRFLELPWRPEERVYRTGDQVRWRPDGTLEFIGRLDHQVKIRGVRVEPGEVEAVLASAPGVGECAVVARPDPFGHPRLVAYVVADGEPVPASWRAWLQARLPDALVPSLFVPLGSLPRHPNGKLDRRSLPEPPAAVVGAFVAPRSAAEELLADLWCDVLGVPRVGVDDNFFELGGHSLLALQVIARLQDTLGLDLSLRRFFRAPTVASLAQEIEAELLAGLPAGTTESGPSESPLAATAA